MSNIKISLFSPNTGIEEAQAVEEVLFSGWLGMGPKTQEFEQKFSEYIGVSNTVAVNSCTAALDLVVKLLNIGPGDEIIVPTITFIATAHAVAYNHAKPIFCDIDPNTLLIDFNDVKRKISKRTKAIIVVHLAGRCVDVPLLKNIVGDICIIEDCAHACGSELRGVKAGNLGDFGCFSFHATKNLTTGDGGAIVSNDKGFSDRAKKMSWLGINKSTWDRATNGKCFWDYNTDEIGLKYHMNDINAAIGLVQLGKLDEGNIRRKQIADLYFNLLNDVSGVILPEKDTEDSKSSWHIFYIKIDNRDELAKYLMGNGISCGVHYKPIHMYGIYGNIPVLPKAESVWESLLSLPIHPNLSDDCVREVVEHIRKFVGDKNE